MKIKFFKSKLFKIFSLALPITSIAIAPALLLSNNANKNTSIEKTDNNVDVKGINDKLIFNNNYYSSLEEAANDTLIKNKNIRDQFMLGDMQDAIFDTQTKRLDESKMRIYDPSRISKVYTTASGKYTESYEDAKKSYVNKGLLKIEYDDLNGKKFKTESEALESLRKHTKGIPIPYYEVKDENGNDVKINPLNKTDIDFFKKIAINSILKSSNDDFKLELFVKDINGNLVRNGTNSKELYKENDAYNGTKRLIFNAFNEFLNSKRNQIFKKVNVELKVKFKGFGKLNDRWGYSFKLNNKLSSELTLNKFNGNPLSLHDIVSKNEDDANSIYAFLKRGTLNKSSNSVKEKRTNDILNKRIANEFFGVNVYGNIFDILFTGNDTGDRGGVDNELLSKGTANPVNGIDIGSTRFDISLSFDKNFLSNDNIKNIIYSDSTVNEFRNILFDSLTNNKDNSKFNIDVLKKITNSELKIMLKNFFDSYIYNDSSNADFFGNKVIKYFNENYRRNVHNSVYKELEDQRKKLGDFGKSITDNFISNINGSVSEQSLKDMANKILGTSVKDNLIHYDKSNSEFIISYKGTPVFSMNDYYSIKNGNGNTKGSFFEENYLNISKDSLLNVDLDSWSNISSKFIKKYDNDGNVFLEYNDKYGTNKNNLIFNNLNNHSTSNLIKKEDVVNLYDTFNQTKSNFELDLSSKSNIDSSLSDSGLTSFNGVALALYSYAKRLDDIGYDEVEKNPLNYENLIKDFSEEVLFLKDDKNQFLPIHYAEFLGTSFSINSPLSTNAVSIYKTKSERDKMLQQNKFLRPAKVVVIYDLDGNVVNSDFKIDGSDYGDGSYNDEETVLNNALNTVIVSQSKDMVFYREDDGTKKRYKNQVNQVFELSLENKKYYYPSFNDAKNELITYIKNNCIFI